MEDDLLQVSAEQLVQHLCNYKRKFRTFPLETALVLVVRRALLLLQEEGSDEDVAEGKDEESRRLRDIELDALYDNQCYQVLISLLSSASISPKALTWATYLLAILTAGGSNDAEEWRSKMCQDHGLLRIVALLSSDSRSVSFNALLVLVNLLRHGAAAHSKFVRLGGLRKLKALFKEAEEEPQRNLCVDALLCLCSSEVPELGVELVQSGCVSWVVEWMAAATAGGVSAEDARIARKGLSALAALVAGFGAQVDGPLAGLPLVPLAVRLLKGSSAEEGSIRQAGVELLARLCCDVESAAKHRESLLEGGGLELLMTCLKETKSQDVLLQVLRLLAAVARTDAKAAQTVRSHVSERLQELLLANARVWPKVGPIAARARTSTEGAEGDSLAPLSEEHMQLVRELCQVSNKRPWENRRHCAPAWLAAGGRVAARVGAD